MSNLIQVLDNIIINAMQAYDGKGGTIDMEIVRSGDNVEFIIRTMPKDPRNIANRLFREMITTKGKNGTGLGLYMSYSTIKGAVWRKHHVHNKRWLRYYIFHFHTVHYEQR